MKTRLTRLGVGAVLATGMAFVGAGCETTDPNSLEAIRADLTPELETLYERQTDMDNNGALVWDENGRMFVEDLGRFWLLTKPSRLTPESIPRP